MFWFINIVLSNSWIITYVLSPACSRWKAFCTWFYYGTKFIVTWSRLSLNFLYAFCLAKAMTKFLFPCSDWVIRPRTWFFRKKLLNLSFVHRVRRISFCVIPRFIVISPGSRGIIYCLIHPFLFWNQTFSGFSVIKRCVVI